ncbi:hypothetical protein [Paratractidigestivibacter faecalis]|uniref:hypothetical protein n=1 Tax=Paratractidigestivibacter faecalis TaxID=2292441 RepID=UPI000E3D873A|nr:hypothetical protein [Paratractidigestivibacter faecalis]
MQVKRNPAVLAGLMGTVALAAPQTAHALSLQQASDFVLASPERAFALGVASGALAVGVACGVLCAVRARSRRNEEQVAAGFAPVTGTSEFPSTDLDEKFAADAPRPRHMRVVQAAPGPEAETAVSAAAQVPVVPSHATDDYGQIAENYVNRITFRERMARRAEGVAAALSGRIGSGMMDGLPVIERADGSVGDVGTSWWTTEVGRERIDANAGFAADEVAQISIPSSFSADAARTALDAVREQQSRSRMDIASRLAFIDEGVFPEHRSVAEAATDDWEQALRSMEENLAADPETPNQDPIEFIDAVGNSETLDEPDNMEPDTSFIPFRTPAGHPEVVDTESYVDYLIEDEFGRNSSKAARRTSRRYLRILEGGTSATSTGMRHLSGSTNVRTRSGKHFAPAQAAEA